MDRKARFAPLYIDLLVVSGGARHGGTSTSDFTVIEETPTMTTTFTFPPDVSIAQGELSASISVTTAQLLARLIDAASSALDVEREAARLYLERASEVLSTDALNRERCARAGPSLALWQRRRVLALIAERLNERLSLDQLAATTRLSRSHFVRAFKASFDQTPHAYLMAHRITTAQLAMISGDKPLSEIALDCGFGDQAHFTRAFHKLVGRPPHVWRRLSRVPSADFAVADACPA
ncbi:MAG: helix-turn-helix domain-containing protein [Brevundimonas sp.]